ncbi:PREDICTED: serine palmitoyltransferase 1 [Acromyrmex echinatior]|uniref:Serine palmitoyltransferase 1 n=1 Tax=Acromyrmex echinatior TaxID=103372 RepID=F4X6W7_ACREC|nr:PREDICTED: serine palmitoyltransferase 1 [Acromyrmex echinatior]EGI57899.1 Serine palmitoyltransferase 1 [Acromyrmex echinatior]
MNTNLLFVESVEVLRNSLSHYHTLLEAILVVWIVWFISKKRSNQNSVPSKELVENKLAEWRPESLVPESPKNHPSLSLKYVTSKVGKRVIVNGKNCLNLGTHNYLGLSDKAELIESAAVAIKKYGVGSCGPRGFYGTVDVHLELEERLAKFMGVEEAIIYSYGFATVSTAIPAYCKRKDLIFVDERVNFAIQKGLDASRGNIQYFKHNDAQDLRNLLMKQEEIDKRHLKKDAKVRRFLIIEGIYMNTGNICPLPELLALCKEYKLRIFIDESISFGTIGLHGRGVTEYFNIPISEIDMIMGSLEWAIGTIGGFCVGASFIIDHQRLSGLGYCFSASQPPLLASAAITSLNMIENNLEILQSLRNNALAIHNGLKEILMLECSSFAESPLKHVYLKEQKDHAIEEKLLSAISNKCIENNLAIIVPVYLETEIILPRPSLRLCISASLDNSDIKFALNTLKKCTEEVLLSFCE